MRILHFSETVNQQSKCWHNKSLRVAEFIANIFKDSLKPNSHCLCLVWDLTGDLEIYKCAFSIICGSRLSVSADTGITQIY